LSDVWATVDRLIHDLGAIRAFLDQADVAGEELVEVAHVRAAMNEATDAITRVFNDSQDAALEAAWEAIARAQDAVRAARSYVDSARAARPGIEVMAQQARGQGERARAQAQQVTEQAERIRRSAGFRPGRESSAGGSSKD
jgi:hypothetical protein